MKKKNKKTKTNNMKYNKSIFLPPFFFLSFVSTFNPPKTEIFLFLFSVFSPSFPLLEWKYVEVMYMATMGSGIGFLFFLLSFLKFNSYINSFIPQPLLLSVNFSFQSYLYSLEKKKKKKKKNLFPISIIIS